MKADPTITPAERARLIALLRHAEAKAVEPSQPSAARVLKRSDAAERLNRSLRFVDQLARDGILRKIKIPNRKRAIGFLEQDVVALMA